jgi:DNA-binding transcriptional LysR family regulator
VVASPYHPLAKKGAVSWEELEKEPIIIREPGSGSRHFMLSLLASHGVKPSVLLEAGSVEFIKEYVIQSRGISFLYKPEIAREAEMGLLRPLKLGEGPIYIETIIVVPDGVTLSPASRAFLEQVDKLKS